MFGNVLYTRESLAHKTHYAQDCRELTLKDVEASQLLFY